MTRGERSLSDSLSLSLSRDAEERKKGRKEGKEGVKSWEILTEHFVSFFLFFVYIRISSEGLKKIYMVLNAYQV